MNRTLSWSAWSASFNHLQADQLEEGLKKHFELISLKVFYSAWLALSFLQAGQLEALPRSSQLDHLEGNWQYHSSLVSFQLVSLKRCKSQAPVPREPTSRILFSAGITRVTSQQLSTSTYASGAARVPFVLQQERQTGWKLFHTHFQAWILCNNSMHWLVFARSWHTNELQLNGSET